MEEAEKRKKYFFKTLWSKTYIGIAINEIYKENCTIPLTTFYFWPREDGWKLLQEELNSKPWMSEQAKVEILNGYTQIINYWLQNINNKINVKNLNIENVEFDIVAINTF
jgi:30S ribosomal protein 3